MSSSFLNAISSPRYSRYFIACGRKQTALKLYRANITLSKNLYAVLGIFEIVLRNSIDRHMKSKIGENWLANSVKPGGFLNAASGCETSINAVQEAIVKLGSEFSHDKLITRMSLGFWIFQFAAKQFAASGNSLLEIFVDRPYGVMIKEVFKKLILLNLVRNRIAHQNSICFDRDKISVRTAERCYSTIIELLRWLGCNPQKILHGIDNVPRAISNIKGIQNEVLKRKTRG